MPLPWEWPLIKRHILIVKKCKVKKRFPLGNLPICSRTKSVFLLGKNAFFMLKKFNFGFLRKKALNFQNFFKIYDHFGKLKEKKFEIGILLKKMPQIYFSKICLLIKSSIY